MTRADCQRCRELFDDFLSSELLVETTQSVLQHVSRCPECEGELRRREALREMLKRVLEEEMPPSLEERILQAIGESGTGATEAAGATGASVSPSADIEGSGRARRGPARHGEERAGGWLRSLAERLRLIQHAALLRTGVRQAAAVLVVAVLSLVLVWVLGGNNEVSASELLRQSAEGVQQVEAIPDISQRRVVVIEERAMPSGRLVSRQRVEWWRDGRTGMKARRVFDESDHLVAGEWLDASGSGNVHRKGAPVATASLAPARPIDLLRGGEAWRMGFSAEEFAWLVGRLEKAKVVYDRDECRITYEAPSDAGGPRVSFATITLSRPDLRPVRQTLRLEREGESREYVFVEREYETIPSDRVAAAVFTPDPGLAAPPAASLAPPPPPPPPKARPAPSPRPKAAPLSVASQVDLLYRLHRADACVKDQLEVETMAGVMHVRGTVAGWKRHAQILAALGPFAENPAVSIDLAVSDVDPPGEIAQEKLAESRLHPASMPGFEPARRYYLEEVLRTAPPGHPFASESLDAAIDAAVERLGHRVRDRSLRALRHAEALERLTRLFDTTRPPGADLNSAATWQTMLRDHARLFRHEVEALRLELQPIFFASASLEIGERASGSRAEPLDLGRVVAEMNEIARSTSAAVLATFPCGPEVPAVAGVEAEEFWRALLRAERLAEEFDVPWRLEPVSR